MSNKVIGVFREYQPIEKKYFTDEEWLELCHYVDFLNYFCTFNEFEIEESPKIISLDKIFLGGFIGIYIFQKGRKLIINPNNEKLSRKEFQKLVEDVIKWGEMYGATFLRNVIQLCSPISIKNDLILAYSDLLNKSTENALLEYIPPKIETRTYNSPIPQGKIKFKETLTNYSKGIVSIVSQRSIINPENILLAFLIRFHSLMVKEINELKTQFLSIPIHQEEQKFSIYLYRRLIQNNIYHQNFILNHFNRYLYERAFEIDFTNSEILEQLWNQSISSPSYRDIILLWEGFIGKRALLPKLDSIISGGYMLKPLSKLYELWCLEMVLITLQKLYGSYEIKREIERNVLKLSFIYRDIPNLEITVKFNQTGVPNKIIKELNKKAGFGLTTLGRPDILIKFYNNQTKNALNLIIEVKYRISNNIKISDIQRFLGYIIAYSKKTEDERIEGLILYLPKKGESVCSMIEDDNSNIRIHLCRIKPFFEDQALKYLEDYFKDYFGITHKRISL